jgi:hypothetical protein
VWPPLLPLAPPVPTRHPLKLFSDVELARGYRRAVESSRYSEVTDSQASGRSRCPGRVRAALHRLIWNYQYREK